jgi:hypothetical protein
VNFLSLAPHCATTIRIMDLRGYSFLSVGTLQTGYPRVPASCRDKGQGVSTCCHTSHGSGPRLLAREGSGATTHSAALDPTSLLERALVLPRAPHVWAPPPCSKGLWCWHASHSFLQVMNKEMLGCNGRVARLTRYRGDRKTCGQTALS